ncbi:MAG: hypothetical protein AAF721_26930, partial [Myxococcota bacterium]
MSDGMPIVICCSDEDQAAIEAAAGPLVDDGHALHFIPGVAGEPRRLAAIITELDRQGLYVLCRSKGLGRAAIEELREVLLAQQVPFSRTLTVAATRPGMVTDRIRGSLGRVKKASAARAAAKPAPKPKPTPEPRPASSFAEDPPTVRVPKFDPSATPPEDFVPYADSEDPPTMRQGPDGSPRSEETTQALAEGTGVGSLPPGLPKISRKGPPPPPPPPPNEDSVVAPLPSSSSVELLRKTPDRNEDSVASMAASISDIDLSDLDYGDTSIGRAPVAGSEDGTVSVRHASLGLRTGDTVIARSDALIAGNTVRARAPGLEGMTARSIAGPGASESISVAPLPVVPPADGGLAAPPLSPAPPRTPTHSSPHIGTPLAASHEAAAAGNGPGLGRWAWIGGGVALASAVVLAVVCSVGGGGKASDTPKTVASKDGGASSSKASETKAGGDTPSDA